MIRIVICTLILSNALLALGQNGKLLSKELIELTPKSIGEDFFRYTGDSLVDQYSYLYDVHIYDITYESDGLLVKGALLEPKQDGNFPTIIFNRGGNRSYAKMSANRLVSTSLAELASQGYVVIASNYRENDEYGGEDVNDVLNLIETLNEVEKADTDRIGMYGWSRGGIMTFLALARTDKIKTAVIGSAPSNLFDVVTERPVVEENILSEYIPNYWENRDEELKNRSVIYWAEDLNEETSILILCGTRDKRVNPKQADLLAEKLEELKRDFELKKFDTGHSFLSKQQELRTLLKKWFDERL